MQNTWLMNVTSCTCCEMVSFILIHTGLVQRLLLKGKVEGWHVKYEQTRWLLAPSLVFLPSHLKIITERVWSAGTVCVWWKKFVSRSDLCVISSPHCSASSPDLPPSSSLSPPCFSLCSSFHLHFLFRKSSKNLLCSSLPQYDLWTYYMLIVIFMV